MAPEDGAGLSLADPAGATAPAGLRHGSLSQLECIGQSVANIAPTLTPALNIAVVAGLAGTGTWLAYLFATIGMMFVAANIGALAQRHPLSGSYFIYIGRTLGPFAGALGGWAMVQAYLFTGVAVLISLPIFVTALLAALGLGSLVPPRAAVMVGFAILMGAAAFRDIRLSSRIGLLLETLSVALLILIMALIVAWHGGIADPAQLAIGRLPASGITASLAFAVFSFVGFESAATLAKETRDPTRAVPRAVMGSAVVAGLFFVVTAYCMVMGMGDDAKAIGDSSSPLADLATHAGIGWLAAVVYFSATVSAFACGLACINSASRMLFSMARYGVLFRRMHLVHTTHRTPHVAILAAAAIIVLASLATLPLAPIDAFGYAGTFGTFGFLVVYLLISIAAPLDRRRAGVMRPRHAILGAVGAVLMALVILGTLVPMPPAPYNLIPYVFLAYMLAGAAWFGWLHRRRPTVLRMIEEDLEV